MLWEPGCTQSQYLCRGSPPLAAVAWPCFALWALICSGWCSVVPVHAHLKQLSELWTLKQMVFLPPLPFLLCYPHLLFRVKAKGETDCLCAQSASEVCFIDQPPLNNVCLMSCPNFFLIQFCSPSLRMMLHAWLFNKHSGNLMWRIFSSCFQIVCVWHFHLLSLADCYICSLREEYCCLASSIKSLCSCNHGSESVRSHSDNQNKTLPAATQHEARFKAATEENHKYQSVYASFFSLTIILLCVTSHRGYLSSHVVKLTVLHGYWN